MDILIIFESVEGQTRKIAEFIEQKAKSAGHSVRRFNTHDRLGTVSFDGIDKVILAAPVHERRHPKNFEVFVGASLAELQPRSTCLISVSLKAAYPDGIEEARDYLTEMEMRTGIEPDKEILVAGAVQTGSYDYYQRQILHNVVLEGRDVALDDGAREFTDWEALSAEIDSFLQSEAP